MRMRMRAAILLLPVMTLALVLSACGLAGPGDPPVKVGLIAPLSGRSGPSGEAIQRGMLLAIDEVNESGGVLGRRLELVTRDVKNDPSAGVAALREISDQHQIVAVFGGIYSPVMLGQLDLIHERKIPLINAWGSITGITQNGREPNFAFRVGLTDAQADEFLVRYAVDVVGVRRPGVMVDTTAWGESNRVGLLDWLARVGRDPAGVERFDQGDTNVRAQLERLHAAGADSIIMAADTSEGAAIVRGMTTLGWQVPVVSHWGVSGGQFVQLAGVENADGILTLQTYTFIDNTSPKSQALLAAYHARFGTRHVDEVLAPIGVAHGYDGLHLLTRAIRQAGTTDGDRVREALENLGPYDGLIKRYDPPFVHERHDPLTASDLLMAVWRNGRLVPAVPARLAR